jgi:hypothetical protein
MGSSSLFYYLELVRKEKETICPVSCLLHQKQGGFSDAQLTQIFGGLSELV